ncbi:interaptin-like [Coccinella septempunctata]|uniref:interaptin-like n=1 Tax=Coccinella septempunctata TaxID=41139 RepID=UPI001D07D683|nr:interaptin-like [Coccinella septempunctata]
MSSWGEILVEWCNCLQLNPKIKDINELRGSDFFKNILSILNKSDVSGTFFHLLTLLNDTYKHAQIDEINCGSFMELPEDKLIIIISLLMHYTCIYDGRDDFTLPLCHNLSKKSQLSIKDFLQNVNKDVTYSDLEKLVGKDRIYEHAESKPTQSPLTAVFRTPSLKRKFNYEKDRTVTKLKTALELEQYQKADIEDDLKLQIKKTQKLEKLLSKSNDEIIALKSEIFKLKCQTPPPCSKRPDLEHTVKLLKKQLANFEHYIENNEREHEQLREEHHLYKEKIEEYELKYAELQKKYLAYDEQIDELTEMLSHKSSEVIHLETYCKELNEILEGYRQQRPISTESSFSEYVPASKANSSIVNPENLASTVIEIQLKESQELNAELLSKVNILDSELNSTKKYLDKKIEENEILCKKIHNGFIKLKEFKKDVQTMKSYYGVESRMHKTSLAQLQQEVKNVLSLHAVSIAKFDSEILIEKENNRSLSIQLTELEKNLVESTVEKNSCINTIESLEHQNKILSVKIGELQSELLASENANKNNCAKMIELEGTIEQNKADLVKFTDDNEKLKHQLNMLHSTLEEYRMTIKTLEETVGQNKSEISQLLSDKKQLVYDMATSKNQNDLLTTELEEYHAKVIILESEIEKNKSKITKLLSEKNECILLIENLQSQNSSLNTQLEEYFSKVKSSEEEIEHNKEQIAELLSEKNQFVDEIEGLKKQNGDLMTEYCDKIKSLEDQTEQSNNTLKELDSEKEKCIHEIEILKNQNQLLNTRSEENNSKIKTLEAAIEENKKQLADLHLEKNHCINETEFLRQQNILLSTNLEETSVQAKNLEEEIEESKMKLAESQSENEGHIREIEALKLQNNILNTTSEEYCSKVKTLESTIEHYKTEVAQLTSDKNHSNDENETLKHQKNLLQKETEEYLMKVKTFEDVIKQREIELAQLHSEKDHCNNEIESLKLQNNLLNTRLEENYIKAESLKDTLEQTKKELANLTSEKTHYMSDAEAMKNEINHLNSRIEKLTTNLVSSGENNEDYQKRLKVLEDVNNEYSRSIESLNASLQKNQLEHEKLMSQNNDLNKKLAITEGLIEDSKLKIELLEHEKTINLKATELLQKNLKEKDTDIQHKDEMMKKYNQALINLKIEMVNTKRNFEDLKLCLANEKNMLYKLIDDLKKGNFELVKSNDNRINEIEEKLLEEKKYSESLKYRILELEEQLTSEKERFSQEIKHLTSERENSCNELRISEKKKNEISNRTIILQETIDNLNSEKYKCLQEIEKKDAKIVELESLLSDLKVQSENNISNNIHLKELIIKYEDSEKKLVKYIDFEKYMKQQIADLKVFHKEEFYKCNKLILKLKESISIFSYRLAESEELRRKMLLEQNEWKESNTSLLKDLENVKAEVSKINNDWADDKKQKEKLLNDNQTLKDNFIGLTQTIKLFNQELNKVMTSLKERRSKSDFILNDIHRAYKGLDTQELLKTPEKSHRTNDVSIEIDNLGQQISKLNAYIDIFSEKETFYLKELETMKEELAASNHSRFDVVQNLKEQILDNEHQIATQTENLHSVVEKYNQLQFEKQECLNKMEKQEKEISEIKKTHLDEITLKKLHITNLQEKIHDLEDEIVNLKKVHNTKTGENIEKLITLENQKSKNDIEIEKYKTKIMALEAQVAIFREEISKLKNKTSKTEEEYESSLANLQVQAVRNKLDITELKRRNEELVGENDNLSTQLGLLNKEKNQEIQERKTAEDRLAEETNINIQLKNDKCALEEKLATLKEFRDKCKKCDDERSNKKFLEEKHIELSQKIEALMQSSEMQKENYETFKIYYKKFKNDFDKLLSQKNSLESLTNNMRVQMVLLNKNILSDESKKLMEKKEAIDIISEDIIKQYNRYSKQINEIVQEFVGFYERNCDNIFAALELKIEDFLEKHNVNELSDHISDLTERAVDILEQIKASQRELENLYKDEDSKMQQKENILTTSKKINIDKIKEDDLKKKNVALKQKVTLLENTKNNLEKTVKKLREENKKLKEGDNKPGTLDNDLHYKMLLQEYISYKEDQEKVLKEYKSCLEDLQKEYEEHKDNCMRSSTPIGNRFFSNPEKEKCLEADLEKLQEAFSNVRINNEKLENENILLKRMIGEHKQEIGKFTSIKEAYDKLLEENNKLMTEVDTMKYKRARDRDEFLRWLKKERYENEMKNTKQIQNIKAEYETKLEKMKDKMIKLYREELNKEMSKIKGRQHESASLLKTIERLECDLFEAKQKIQLLTEREMRKNQEQNIFSQMHGSNSQVHELDTLSLKDFPLSCMNSTAIDSRPRNSIAKLMEFKHPSKVNPSSLDTRKQYDERQVKTLPRSGTIVEEVNIRRRTSFGVPNSMGNLQMEDEEEMFNNKYLTDLKQGKCDLPSSEDRDSRVSELAWRNSLVPPHLKSSYPAETQFCSPERFREDDLKSGGAFDDSSCKLLPAEKRKKDFGTTSYKKPGPPTPSKNGGRLSLTGSEMHVTKDQHSESKKSTPGRIRSLFTGRSSSRSSIEPGTSPKKRLSIFRR